MKTLRKIGRLWTQLWQWFPPGYEFVWERNTAAVLLALPVVLSLRYFGKLREAVEWLYYVDGDRGRVLRPDGAWPAVSGRRFWVWPWERRQRRCWG